MAGSNIRKTIWSWLFLVMLLGFWEIFARYYTSMKFVLPPPSGIAETLWTHKDRFLFHTSVTLKEMMGGFVLAQLAAFPLAWGMSYFAPLRTVLQPLFVIINCVPMFALAPIMVIWFGWSYTAIVIPTALMIFFPLTMNIYQGLSSTPQHFLEFFRMHNATVWQTFSRLQLPWALPHLFAGFRIAAALAGIGAVAGEWAGAQAGLGLLMLESRRAADLEMTFGALTCVVVMSLSLYACAIYFEKKVSRKHRSKPLHTRLMVCLLFSSYMLTGCQEQPKSAEQTTLVLDWLPNPNHVALYAGLAKGCFKDQGIDLAIIKVPDPSDVLPYLTSGQVDICLTYMPHTIRAMMHGASITPIGILIEEPLNALIYRKGEEIASIQDLNDLTFGYCVDGFNTNFLRFILEKKGIVPKDMHNVSFDLVHTLAGKHVDVIYGAYWNIECENLRHLGTDTDYFPLGALDVPPYYELIFLTNTASLQAAPDFISSFQKGLQASIDYAIANPEEAYTAYLNANPDKGRRTRQWEHDAWLKTVPTLAKQQVIDPHIWNNFIEWLAVNGLIPEGARQAKIILGSDQLTQESAKSRRSCENVKNDHGQEIVIM